MVTFHYMWLVFVNEFWLCSTQFIHIKGTTVCINDFWGTYVQSWLHTYCT